MGIKLNIKEVIYMWSNDRNSHVHSLDGSYFFIPLRESLSHANIQSNYAVTNIKHTLWQLQTWLATNKMKIISLCIATSRLQIKIRARWSLAFILANSFQQD